MKTAIGLPTLLLLSLGLCASGCDCGGGAASSADGGVPERDGEASPKEGRDATTTDEGPVGDIDVDDGHAGLDAGGGSDDAGEPDSGETRDGAASDADTEDAGPCTATSLSGMRWLFVLDDWHEDPQGCSQTSDHTGEEIWADIDIQDPDALLWAYFPENAPEPPLQGTVVQGGEEIDGSAGEICNGYSWWIVKGTDFCHLNGTFGLGSGGPQACCQWSTHFTGGRQ
ncbi:MAG: hypothetical protein HY897_18285 [Deltaproteobacteria bacterium]|nr:hypothetical protein [Deltaproteobacteria bacterium]